MSAIQQALMSYGRGVNTALRDLILANAPTNYWRNGEGSGSVMVDEIAADGTYIGGPTLNNAPLYPGGLTTAGGNFDGVNLGLSYDTPPSLASMTLITIIRPTNVTGFRLLGVQRDDNGSVSRAFQWRSNGSAMEFVKIVGGVETISQAGMLAINTTYLLGFEVSSSGAYAMYRNGVSVKTGTIGATDYGGVADPWSIGYSNGAGTNLAGRTCENAVFDKVLGSTVHAALFAATGL